MQKAAGVYAGELPCADCSGIRTTLYLRANGVYTRISEYVGRDTFEDGGQWTIDEKGVVTMTPAVKGGQPSLARVEEGAVVTLIQEALCSGDARCVVEAVEKACRLKGLPVPHELYGEMTLESLIAVMAAIGLDLRTERLN